MGEGTELELTSEEQHWIDDLALWLETPLVGNDIPAGVTPASLLAGDPIWNACTTDAERMAFLLSFGPFSRFWDWLQGIGDAARRMALYLKMVDMLVAAVLRLIQGGGAGAC